MKRELLIGGLLAALSLAGGCGKNESDIPAGPAWAPDAAQLGALGDEHPFDRYQLRPPKDFKFVAVPLGAREVAAISWVSQTPDVGHGSLLGVIVSLKPDRPLQTYLEVAAFDLQKSTQDFKKSDAEKGSIQGKEFVRAYWSGRNKGSAVRGFIYVGRDRDKLIRMMGIMGESHQETSQPLLEASALTFRLK